MKTLQLLSLSVLVALSVNACDLFEPDEEGPNELSGSTNLEMTNPGQKFDAFVDLSDWIPDGFQWEDSIIVTKREGGVVTMDVNIKFESKVIETLDTVFGTSGLPLSAKMAVIDALLVQYGATMDTSEAGFIKIHAEPKFKITSEGIQEFVSSRGNLSKPFTIIKYSAKVGDSWTFKRDDGVMVTRKVTYHSTTDDYPVGFLLLKVFKTESTPDNDPLFEKIIFVTNHKFGTVGAHLFTKDGKEIRFGVWPPTL